MPTTNNTTKDPAQDPAYQAYRSLLESLKADDNEVAREILQGYASLNKGDVQDPRVRLYRRAQWVCITLLSEDQFLEMVRTRLQDLVDIGLDLWPKIQQQLLNIAEYHERDTMRRKVREALASNNEPFPKKNPERFTSNKTIGSWVNAFRVFLGDDQGVNVVRIGEFLSKNPDAQKLTQEEKDQCSRILKAFQHLLPSSTEFEGVEESYTYSDEQGKRWIVSSEGMTPINAAEFEPILKRIDTVGGSPVTPTSVQDAVTTILRQEGIFSPEAETIVAKQSAHDPASAFIEWMKSPHEDQTNARAAVFALLRQISAPQLESVLKEQSLPGETPQRKVKALLEQIAGMDANTSALVVMQLMIKGTLPMTDEPMIYFDEHSNSFRWA